MRARSTTAWYAWTARSSRRNSSTDSRNSASSGGTRAADGFRRKIPRRMLDPSQPADCAGSTHADHDILIANQETHAKFSWLKEHYGKHSGPLCARTRNPLKHGVMVQY